WHAARDRRDSHARLVALLAGRPLSAGQRPAQLRQAAAARLPRGFEATGQVERRPAAPAAAGGGRGGDQQPLPRCVPANHWAVAGGHGVRVAPEGWPFIGIAWALAAVAVWAALKGSPWWWLAAIPLLAL